MGIMKRYIKILRAARTIGVAAKLAALPVGMCVPMMLAASAPMTIVVIVAIGMMAAR